MKTNNYNMELMVPMQNNKEIIFNESINLIDNFCNNSVISFIDEPPEVISTNQKYIINEGINRGNICYCGDESKNWQFLKPFSNMIIYIQKNNGFFIYENDEWISLNLNVSDSQNSTSFSPKLMAEDEVFKSIANVFEINNEDNYLYLYLNNNCRINLSNLKLKQITITIKQNFQASYQISWPVNILWKDKVPHQMTITSNSIDVISLYKLPETNHFLGYVISQAYSF